MQPEEKKLLEETYKLAEENNEMLHKIRMVQKRQAIFIFIKWFLIIGASVGIFYFLQPYVDVLKSFIGETSSTLSKIKELMPR